MGNVSLKVLEKSLNFLLKKGMNTAFHIALNSVEKQNIDGERLVK